LKPRLLRTFGQRSDLLFAIPGFIVLGPENVRNSVGSLATLGTPLD
jgi:hypothetical protein